MAARNSIATRWYRDAAGNDTKSPTAAAVAAVMKFSDDTELVFTFAELNAETQYNVMGHGVLAKVGDKFAAAHGDVGVAKENALAIWEQLQSGVWSQRSGGGPRISLLVEAIIAAKAAKGDICDAARIADIREKCKNRETREGAMKDKDIKAAYDAAAAVKKVAAAKASAKEAKASTDEGLLGTF